MGLDETWMLEIDQENYGAAAGAGHWADDWFSDCRLPRPPFFIIKVCDFTWYRKRYPVLAHLQGKGC